MPYLNDLLWFEWLEIEGYMMPDAPPCSYVREGDLLTDRIVINPEHRITHFKYPVSRAKEQLK